MARLSKSNYIMGLQCPLALWNKINGLKEPDDLATKRVLDQGDEVGELAKKLFPKGLDIPKDNVSDNLQKTKEALKKKKALFEAGFQAGDCYARADILIPIGKEWDLIEVKSSNDVKDYHLHDLSFQKYVIESSGLKIRKCYIMHLNRDYVRNGKLDIKKLFLMVEAEVDAASKGLNERIKLLCNVISSPKKPLAGILLPKIIKDGYHECLKENCLNLPDDNIFCLRGGSKLPLELFKNGIKSIRNIPSSVKLNGKQKIQEDCAIRNTAHIDKAKIEGFLRQLKYPVYYLDFETFNCAIPMFDGVKPFSNIPFQFSLHVVEKENAKPVHYQYLYRGFSDPRREFILELKKALGNSGSIVAFNESFEKSVLKALAERFPSDKKWIDLTLSKFVDLILPFRDFSYYNPRQYGSASLKEVLPALTGKSYSGMQISGGMEASDKYFLATYKKDSGLNREKVLNDLLEYCGLDTYGMVMIVDKLKGMV